MTTPASSLAPGFFDAVGRVFIVFFALAKKARRTRFFIVFSFLPVAVALIIKFNQAFSAQPSFEGMYLFTNIIMFFYLQLIILILALFYGTSVCSEEVEGKTLPYLTTRPVPRSAIVTGKFAAYSLAIIIMVALGMIMSFLVLNIDRLFDAALYPIFFRFLGVSILGIVAYTALFTLFGSFLKRSIFFGLLFCFGWENVIQYFPGSTQKLAVAHYLKSFLPRSSPRRFSFLTFRLEATRPGLALLILILISAAFLALAALLFSKKEYILED